MASTVLDDDPSAFLVGVVVSLSSFVDAVTNKSQHVVVAITDHTGARFEWATACAFNSVCVIVIVFSFAPDRSTGVTQSFSLCTRTVWF